MKRLQRYYFLVGIPVLLIGLGATYFNHEIMGTINGNPHPQINYLIILLIVGGCIQMLLHVRRINAEGELIEAFSDLLLNDKNINAARALVHERKSQSESDVVEVLEMVLDTHASTVDAIHHSAIESEIGRFAARQNRRLLLAGFMSGMMVGLGLLGTFIGLLGALTEISKLIGSFSARTGISDPLEAVNQLVTRLTEPMKAMGVAFSASLFGVLGSLIMSMLMVFIKSATVELVSLLETRVSRLTDLGDSVESARSQNDIEELNVALSSLANQSPVLKGLLVAMDQSERRVRQTINSVQTLVGELHAGIQHQQFIQASIERLAEAQTAQMKIIEAVQETNIKVLNTSVETKEFHLKLFEKDEQQRALLKAGLDKADQHNLLLLDQQGQWLNQMQTQRSETAKTAELARNEIQRERDEWFKHLKSWADNTMQQQALFNSMAEKFELTFQAINQEARKNEQYREQIKSENLNVLQYISHDKKFSDEQLQQRNAEIAQRAELMHQLKLSQLEHQQRFEQLIGVLSTQLDKFTASKSVS